MLPIEFDQINIDAMIPESLYMGEVQSIPSPVLKENKGYLSYVLFALVLAGLTYVIWKTIKNDYDDKQTEKKHNNE